MSHKIKFNAKSGNQIVTELTHDEIDSMQADAARAAAKERTRPLTESEVSRMLIAQQINSLDIDDATASRMADYFPGLTGDGSLIKAGTRINWRGTLKRAAVDLWDTASNIPDAAPTLWEDLDYRDGVRVIPETITVGLAFNQGELGWWGGKLYKSLLAANVYTPEQYPAGWEEQ